MSDELLDLVLHDVSGGRPEMLTGGQRQLVALSVRLAHEHYHCLVVAALGEVATSSTLREALAQVGVLT